MFQNNYSQKTRRFFVNIIAKDFFAHLIVFVYLICYTVKNK